MSDVEATGRARSGRIVTLPSTGARVRVEAINLDTLAEVERRAAPLSAKPAPPARDAPVFGGAERIVMTDLDDLEGLEDDPQYAQWRAAVLEYRDALHAWNLARAEARARLIVGQGVYPLDVDEADMRTALETVGLDAPEGAEALRMAYVRHWLLRTGADWAVAFGAVAELTAVTEEDVREALAGFRDHVQRAARRDAGADAGAGDQRGSGVRGDERGSRVRRRRNVPAGRADDVADGAAGGVAAGAADA